MQEMIRTAFVGDQVTHGGQKGFGMTKHGRSGHASRSPRFRFLQRLEATEERSQGPLSDQGPETVHRRAIPSLEANTNLTNYPLTFGVRTFAFAIAEQVDV
jgi:hypothetical protein